MDKEGILIIGTKPYDEIWVGAIRFIVMDKGRIGIQAPKEIPIETVQPWRKRQEKSENEDSKP